MNQILVREHEPSRAADEVASAEGFRAAAEGCHTALLRLATRMVSDPHTAEDLVQETFARAFAARGRFRGDARPFAWFCSILLNLARTALRRAALRRLVSLDRVLEEAGPRTGARRSRRGPVDPGRGVYRKLLRHAPDAPAEAAPRKPDVR